MTKPAFPPVLSGFVAIIPNRFTVDLPLFSAPARFLPLENQALLAGLINADRGGASRASAWF